MTEKEIQLIIGQSIGIKNICIPNVILKGEWKRELLAEIIKLKEWERPSKMYEADLLYITGKGYLTEVEIKTDINDFERDFYKVIYHSSPLVRNLYYAIPLDLYKRYSIDIDSMTAEKAGIIVVEKKGIRYIKKSPPRAGVKPLTENQKIEFMRLGCMKWFKNWSDLI